MKGRRVFLGLIEVAGFYRGLEIGFKQLGVPCVFVNLYPHKFKYVYPQRRSPFLKLVDYIANKNAGPYNGLWSRISDFIRLPLFLWSLFKFDTFILGFGTTFFYDTRLFGLLGYADLYLIKRLGKTLIFQFHGSDSRPEFIDGAVLNSNNGMTIEECHNRIIRKKNHLRMIDHYASYLIDIPPQGGYFHDRPFIIWMYVGLPSGYQGETYQESNIESEEQATVRILHSPSNPKAKGSVYIQRIIEKLKSKGRNIEFIQIVNKPNEEVLKELTRCDFVIDQSYADYPMPGFPTEAAWMGKPVVIGGYCVDHWNQLMDDETRPPTLYCYPEKMEAVIDRLIIDKAYRQKQGNIHKDFMQQKWHPQKVAERYLKIADGDIPDEWWYDPSAMDEVYGGFFIERKKIRAFLKEYIDSEGIESLLLDDKPVLKQKIFEFAYQDESEK